ncbi:flagellar assembly peptidoglycan hydrolase FlgJ [Aliidiomarina taiwanensis]|uniref:Peptidoglycan hydrolase FlgJ n=2 Tax=Aliidiomarina taiwanensis TaxID=946228 RepID=A0A432X894_9GAMM|nr:flagellar assembly peptidoglycan hydrolase FlgJ [Aliidiomarina taiwanensis]
MLQHAQSTSVLDLQSLDALRRQGMQGKEAEQKALRQAAEHFESIFMSQLLSSMRKANEIFGADNPLNTQYTKFYEDMHDQQLSSELAKNGSLGLADLIVQQLSPAGTSNYTPASLLPVANLDTSMAQRGIRVVREETPKEQAPAGILERIPALRMATDDQDWRPASPLEFLQRLAPYAQKAAEQASVSPATVLAQAALETGWGQHVIRTPEGQSSNNVFNIKADTRWTGATVSTQTHEFEDGQRKQEQAHFRAYRSVAESFHDYVSFLQSNPRYQQALEVGRDAIQFAEQLQQAGYATDPEYANKLKRILSGDAMQAIRQQFGF